MCEANVYIARNDKEELVMESVDVVEPLEGGEWFVKNIFGEQMKVTGGIKYISLINHRIVFDESPGS